MVGGISAGCYAERYASYHSVEASRQPEPFCKVIKACLEWTCHVIDGLIEHSTQLKTVHKSTRRSEVPAAGMRLFQGIPELAGMTVDFNSRDIEAYMARTRMHDSMKLLRTEIGQSQHLTNLPGNMRDVALCAYTDA